MSYQMDNTRVVNRIKYIDETLKPRTPKESAATLALAYVERITKSQIDEWATKQNWRTKTTTFRGHEFCEKCEQIIVPKYCDECGLPLPAVLPNAFDLLPVQGERRINLENAAAHLLANNIRPKLVRALVQSLNMTHLTPHLDFYDVHALIDEALALEVQRRGV